MNLFKHYVIRKKKSRSNFKKMNVVVHMKVKLQNAASESILFFFIISQGYVEKKHEGQRHKMVWL